MGFGASAFFSGSDLNSCRCVGCFRGSDLNAFRCVGVFFGSDLNGCGRCVGIYNGSDFTRFRCVADWPTHLPTQHLSRYKPYRLESFQRDFGSCFWCCTNLGASLFVVLGLRDVCVLAMVSKLRRTDLSPGN